MQTLEELYCGIDNPNSKFISIPFMDYNVFYLLIKDIIDIKTPITYYIKDNSIVFDFYKLSNNEVKLIIKYFHDNKLPIKILFFDGSFIQLRSWKEYSIIESGSNSKQKYLCKIVTDHETKKFNDLLSYINLLLNV